MSAALALVIVLGAGTWADDVAFSRAPKWLTPQAEPGAIAWIIPKRKTIISIEGPCHVDITLFGVERRKKKRYSGPGSIRVTLPGDNSQSLKLDGSPMNIPVQRRGHRLLTPQTFGVDVPAGKHRFTLKPNGKAIGGVGLTLKVTRPPAEVETDAQRQKQGQKQGQEQRQEQRQEAASVDVDRVPDEEPVAPALPEPDATDPQGIPEPELFEPDLPAEPPLPDLSRPSATSEDGLRVISQMPKGEVAWPEGVEEFLIVPVDGGLLLEAEGPALVRIGARAIRNPDHPNSQQSVVLGVLLDDVLDRTVTLPDAITPNAQLLQSPHSVSDRADLNIAIPTGRHKLEITVSDEAILGVLLAPRIVTSLEEPDVPGQRRDLMAEAPDPSESYATTNTSRLGVSAGVFLPASLTRPGPHVALSGDYGLGGDLQNLGVGAEAFFSKASDSLLPPSGLAQGDDVSVSVASVTLGPSLRWTIPVNETVGFSMHGGGGIQARWFASSQGQISRKSKTLWSWAAWGRLSIDWRLGPGLLSLEAGYVVSGLSSTRGFKRFDVSGGTAALGYGIEL